VAALLPEGVLKGRQAAEVVAAMRCRGAIVVVEVNGAHLEPEFR
jgi:hypothetical protein